MDFVKNVLSIDINGKQAGVNRQNAWKMFHKKEVIIKTVLIKDQSQKKQQRKNKTKTKVERQVATREDERA